MGNRLSEKSWFSTAVLLILLVVLSTCSLFVGVTDIDLSTLLHDREGMEAKIFLLRSRGECEVIYTFLAVCTDKPIVSLPG